MYEFQYSERMGIEIPVVYVEWETIPVREREEIVERWEKIRGRIPDRIQELDRQVEEIQKQISQEEDWERVCNLFTELSRLASVISELNIWFRKQQEV